MILLNSSRSQRSGIALAPNKTRDARCCGRQPSCDRPSPYRQKHSPGKTFFSFSTRRPLSLISVTVSVRNFNPEHVILETHGFNARLEVFFS